MSKLTSFKQKGDLDSLTRKGKADLIDSKIIEFEDNFALIDQHFLIMQNLVDTKIDKELINILREDKISKSEIHKYLPDANEMKMKLEDILKDKMDII